MPPTIVLVHGGFAESASWDRIIDPLRPATQEALQEPAGEGPLWEELPSWFLIGEEAALPVAA